MAIGKESRIVDLIRAKTKLSKEDIYDVLWVLPEVLAELFMELSPKEKASVHLGILNAYWQDSRTGKPGIVFKPTERFKSKLTQLKFEGKTPLAKELYSHLPDNIKQKVIKRLS